MDSIKTFNIGADYKDHKTPLSWESRLFAEIVFIDKTHESSNPLVYQLKDNTICLDDLTQGKNNLQFFPKESFVLMGELLSIDKKKKQLFLSNQNVVSYRYMVIVSGITPVVTVYGDEFTAGINALIDALRMRAKIPSSFANQRPISEKALSSFSQEAIQEMQDLQIDKIVQPTIQSATSHHQGVELSSIHKRLYEVQL